MTGIRSVLLVLPWTAFAADPSASELIRRAMEAEKAQAPLRAQFTYREDVEQVSIDKSGKRSDASTQTFDVVLLEGEPYRKLTLIDGKPLDAKMQEKVDRAMEKERGERRKRSTLRTIRRQASLGGLDSLENLFDNRVTGTVDRNGRPAWRMESTPKPGRKPANKEEEQILSARKVTYFDQQDGTVARREDEFLRESNGFQPGTRVAFQYAPQQGVWLLDRIVLAFHLKAYAVLRAWGETTHRFSNYKRFTVESTITADSDPAR